MPIDLLIFTILLTALLVPLLAPRGKWFWISSAGIFIFLTYEQVQSYLFRANMENKYGPGQMLGDILLDIICGTFLLGLAIRLAIWGIRKLRNRLATLRKSPADLPPG